MFTVWNLYKLFVAVFSQYLLFSPTASCQTSIIIKCHFFSDIPETYIFIAYINRKVFYRASAHFLLHQNP